MSFDQEVAKLNFELRRKSELADSAKLAKSILLNNKALELAEKADSENQNSLDEALKLINEAIDLNPFNYLAMINKADFLTKLERCEEAIEAANKVLELDPDNQIAKELLSVNMNNQYTDDMIAGEHEKALEKINKALELKPNERAYLYNKAAVLFRMGRIDEALDFANKSIELDDKFVNPKSLKAIIYNHKFLEEFNRGNYDEAFDNVNQALELKSNEVGIHVNRISCLIKLRRFSEAESAHELAVKLDPNNDDLQYLHELIAKKKFRFKVEDPSIGFIPSSPTHIPQRRVSAEISQNIVRYFRR